MKTSVLHIRLWYTRIEYEVCMHAFRLYKNKTRLQWLQIAVLHSNIQPLKQENMKKTVCF